MSVTAFCSTTACSLADAESGAVVGDAGAVVGGAVAWDVLGAGAVVEESDEAATAEGDRRDVCAHPAAVAATMSAMATGRALARDARVDPARTATAAARPPAQPGVGTALWPVR